MRRADVVARAVGDPAEIADDGLVASRELLRRVVGFERLWLDERFQVGASRNFGRGLAACAAGSALLDHRLPLGPHLADEVVLVELDRVVLLVDLDVDPPEAVDRFVGRAPSNFPFRIVVSVEFIEKRLVGSEYYWAPIMDYGLWIMSRHNPVHPLDYGL